MDLYSLNKLLLSLQPAAAGEVDRLVDANSRVEDTEADTA